MWLFIGIFFTAFIFGLHHLVRSDRRGKLINKIPGPYAWPLIGNHPLFMVPKDKLWRTIRKVNDDYYPINRLWSVAIPIVNLRHPDDVGALLSSSIHIEKSFAYDFLHPWLGTGLLTSKGKKWHDRRRILTPAFHFSVLQQFVEIFIEHSEKFVESLRLQGEEVTCDLLPILHKYTMNSICDTAMGATTEMNETFMNRYRSCVFEMGSIIVHRIFRPWLYVDWMFKLSEKFQKQVEALKILHGFSRKIIKERKQYHSEMRGQYSNGLKIDSSEPDNTSDSVNSIGKRRLAMLDLLISESERNANIDDEGIREEVDTFVFEGHDTTAMALCFALLLLAENRDIQEKARSEIDALLEAKDMAELSLRDINGLAYLERCLKESLRLFPSVPFVTRILKKDLHLKNHVVPGGTAVHLHIYDTHRDPNFWPNPHLYDPDRFLPERSQGRHRFAYVPFSAGPRNCIGQKFAMIEMKVLVANILKNFYLEPIDLSSEVEIFVDLVLRPTSSVRIKFIQRSHITDSNQN